MNMRIRPPALLLAALALASGIATAQQGAGLTPQTTPAGIGYLTGGVGEAQQQAMKDMMQDYNLRLTFARPERGAYLANVKVVIDRAEEGTAGSQMLAATTTGPMLFVKLPAGNYRVRAEFDGQVQSHAVSIAPGKAQDLVVYLRAK